MSSATHPLASHTLALNGPSTSSVTKAIGSNSSRAMNPVVRGDIVVSTFLDSVGGYRHKERRDRLLDILDIDLDWRMHQISDGERRRVQLCFGLMVEWDVLLLDEVNCTLLFLRFNLCSSLLTGYCRPGRPRAR
jgi:ABC-type uncharacterized transport system ATPase subunit